jgi:selenide,water dikinase
VRACTDITGFGLAGHASEMAAASGVCLRIDAAALPVLDGAEALAAGNVPGGGRTNEAHFGPAVTADPAIPANRLLVAYDPQTSGGLLIAVQPAHLEALREGLLAAGAGAWVIGRAETPAGGVHVTLA